MEEALLSIESTLQQLDGKLKADTLIAQLYHKQGVSYYFLEKEIPKAIDSYKKALTIRKKFYPQNHIDIIKGLRNIGVAYYLNSEDQEAAYYLQQSLEKHLSRTNKDLSLLANTHMDLGPYILEKMTFKMQKFT